MQKKRKNWNKKEKKYNLINLIQEKEELISEIEKIKKELSDYSLNKSFLNEINKEIKYLNDLIEIIIKNKDDENKLNDSLLFFMDEWVGKTRQIDQIIEEEIKRINYELNID